MNRKRTEALLQEIEARVRTRRSERLRQANKRDLVAIGRALGLQCSERERSTDLAKRVLAAAECLRSDRDHLARHNAELSRRGPAFR